MDEQQHSLLSVQVTLTEYDTSHEFNDAAVLSRDVWRELGLPERLNQSIAVSIQPPPNYSSAYPIRCWARLSELSSYGVRCSTSVLRATLTYIAGKYCYYSERIRVAVTLLTRNEVLDGISYQSRQIDICLCQISRSLGL